MIFTKTLQFQLFSSHLGGHLELYNQKLLLDYLYSPFLVESNKTIKLTKTISSGITEPSSIKKYLQPPYINHFKDIFLKKPTIRYFIHILFISIFAKSYIGQLCVLH